VSVAQPCQRCDRCFISSGCYWKCLRGEDLATIAHLKEMLHRAASYGGIEPQLEVEIRAALYTEEAS
jgi:thymidylate kinase